MLTVTTNGIRLQYRIDGTPGHPVVMFSNSLATELTLWDEQVHCLIEAGYQVVRYNVRGHGDSSIAKGPYSIESLAKDAIFLMDAFGLKRVHFCGISLGGMVGQRMATNYSDRLISLILCSTSAYMPPVEMWDERIANVRENGLKSIVDSTLNRWFTKHSSQNLVPQLDKIRNIILGTSIEGYCGCCAAIRDMDQREKIKSITTPTLVIVGENDHSTTVATAELIHEHIAASKLSVFSGAAHILNIEHPETFNHSVIEFLDSIPNDD